MDKLSADSWAAFPVSTRKIFSKGQGDLWMNFPVSKTK